MRAGSPDAETLRRLSERRCPSMSLTPSRQSVRPRWFRASALRGGDRLFVPLSRSTAGVQLRPRVSKARCSVEMQVMPNARVAVIDDDRMVREMLELGLSREGYEVRTATDGLAALELVKVFDPELIVLDIMMPKIDGVTLLPRLREITQAPILMLTAKGGTEDKVRSLSSGADDYLVKPFVFEELIARLQAKLRRPSSSKRTSCAGATSRSTPRRAKPGAEKSRSSSRSASSICSKSSCASRAGSSAKIICSKSFGGTILRAARISSKRIYRTCVRRSIAPASPGRSSERSAAWATGFRNKPTAATMKLAARLSALYAVLLGVTVLIVIVASSIALVFELQRFSGDVIIAKHEEARILVDQYRREGMTLQQAAPQIVGALSGIGLRVTVYDLKGRYLAGDKTLRPKAAGRRDRRRRNAALHSASSQGHRGCLSSVAARSHASRADSRSPTSKAGTSASSLPFRSCSFRCIPYWRIVITIALAAMLLSWFVGRLFAQQSLRPINEVSDSLRALADGDYTQRRFVMAGGDEIASLTAAFNDAVASVATAIDHRRHAEERMRQFAADASHELRTPLTVIAGYIDVLRRGAIEEPRIARQILATMSIEKEHMRGLIDRLMRLARLDSEEPPNIEQVDVAELLRSQVEAARRLDDRRHIDYSVDGVKTIEADRGELGEAVWNVIENALKYAPDAPIHLRAARTNGHAVITVSDEGPGMSESERLHAFERFYRGDQRGEIAGTGFGLAIAKRAIERVGGDITIDSAPGHGTAVTITI